MTRRDFQVIADGVKEAREELKADQAHDGPVLSESQWEYIFICITDNLARKLGETNPAFNASLFKKACNP